MSDKDATADDGFYASRVNCLVTDESNNIVAFQEYSDDGDRQGYAAITMTFTANPGSTYTVTAHHSAVFTEPYDSPPPGVQMYFDEYNFLHYVETPDSQVADQYTWYGPGPPQATRSGGIGLPPTVAKKHYPKVNITIDFSGTKMSPIISFSLSAVALAPRDWDLATALVLLGGGVGT
jgi:hypothetical protein